jgi:hypothetical protein
MGKQTKLQGPVDPAGVTVASTLPRRVWLFAVIVVSLLAVWLGSVFATSPESIRHPKFEHYHFRMQLIVDGKVENFGKNTYQTNENAASCDVELTDTPIHFHDNKDQFVHIHWDDMTGGLVLKNYGWNFIGGSDTVLGYRFDNLTKIKSTPIHSDSLPNISRGSKYYVYTGDRTSFVERSFEEFKSQDLETFFGKKSNLNTGEQGFLNRLFPKVHAHDRENHTRDGQKTPEEINNLIGNVVIFVQKHRPNYEQVRDRFQKLEPLSDSTCAG